MSKLDALVVDKFLERYKDAFGSVIDEPTAPELEPLRKRLDDAQRALESFLEDTDFLAALKPDQRMKLLDKLNADVEEARLALDSVEVKNVTSVANVIDLGDYFEPSGFAEAEIPEQRRLLLAGIERVVVAKGKGDTEKRVSIDWKT